MRSINNCGVEVGLSSVWLGELYRLVTTYDILTKAGYRADDVSLNRALIELLSDNSRAPRNTDNNPKINDPIFIHVMEERAMSAIQRQGGKFVRRVLLLTWESLLEVLRVPIESPSSDIGNYLETVLDLVKRWV